MVAIGQIAMTLGDFWVYFYMIHAMWIHYIKTFCTFLFKDFFSIVVHSAIVQSDIYHTVDHINAGLIFPLTLLDRHELMILMKKSIMYCCGSAWFPGVSYTWPYT